MFDWIIKNKEWLFSGAGIAVISGIIFIIRHFYSKAKNDISKIADPQTIKSVRNILADQIYIDAEKMPPYQKDKYLVGFNGIEVTWKAELISCSQESSNKNIVSFILIYLNSKYDAPILITGDVSLKENKKLAIAPKGTKILVHGKISGITSMRVILGNARLEFL